MFAEWTRADCVPHTDGDQQSVPPQQSHIQGAAQMADAPNRCMPCLMSEARCMPAHLNKYSFAQELGLRNTFISDLNDVRPTTLARTCTQRAYCCAPMESVLFMPAASL